MSSIHENRVKYSENASESDHKASWLFLAILGVLMAFTSLATDFYLPAMPKMQEDLHGEVELTITGFLTGFAIAWDFDK